MGVVVLVYVVGTYNTAIIVTLQIQQDVPCITFPQITCYCTLALHL